MEKRYKQARLQSRIKLNEASEIFGVTQPTVSAWESGRQNPSLDILILMADTYHVSVEYLLGYDSLEKKDTKSPIPKENIGLFHAKPVWVQGKGWALVNSIENTLIFADESPEKICDDTALYCAIQTDFEFEKLSALPLTRDDLTKQNTVWVEPVSSDRRLCEMLRGRYTVKNEYVEDSRGNRFWLDNYRAGWLAFPDEDK